MNLQWEPKIGPAIVITLTGSLSVLITIGVIYGISITKLENALIKAENAEKSVSLIKEHASLQNERLGKIETSIQFIIPAIQRIEAAVKR